VPVTSRPGSAGGPVRSLVGAQLRCSLVVKRWRTTTHTDVASIPRDVTGLETENDDHPGLSKTAVYSQLETVAYTLLPLVTAPSTGCI